MRRLGANLRLELTGRASCDGGLCQTLIITLHDVACDLDKTNATRFVDVRQVMSIRQCAALS